MNNHILFVHIPKTAGTSFRLAAQRYFGDDNTFYDYSPSSVETSEEVLHYVYQEQDLYGLSTCFAQGEKVFLCGHFPTSKYASFFESLNIITFVRNPLHQVLSHYKHHKTHLDYEEDLESFIQDQRFKNLQSRILSGRPLEFYGFIGLTEEYSKSIELINDYYGLDIAILEENISIHDETLTLEKLSPAIIQLIEAHNKEDFNMYNHVKKIFDERMKCHQNGVPYVHAVIQEYSVGNVRGCAFSRTLETPVEVSILGEGWQSGSLYANEHRLGMCGLNLPRKGFVGFSYADKNISGNERLVFELSHNDNQNKIILNIKQKG
jgi:hypothetical protein